MGSARLWVNAIVGGAPNPGFLLAALFVAEVAAPDYNRNARRPAWFSL